MDRQRIALQIQEAVNLEPEELEALALLNWGYDPLR
jgi:hypothetical protein